MNARQFALRQQRPLGPLRKLIRAVLHAFGVPITPLQIDQTAQMLYRPILTARNENYSVGLRYLVDLEPSGIVVPPPREYPSVALTSTIERITTKIRIVGEPVTEATRTDTRVIEMVRPAIEGPILRQALEPARETVATIGEDEAHAEYGWARVLVGAYSCSFCAMLASRGAVYTSRAAAKGKGGSAMDVYHTPHPDTRPGGKGAIVGGFCDCSVALVKRDAHGDELPWEGQAAQRALEDLWMRAQEDWQNDPQPELSGHPLNVFRREWERKVRASQTHKYLAPSLQPKVA
jgi:hypothetical protein